VANIFDPLVLGVDVARYGDDETVIYVRKGRDGRTWPPERLRGMDTMQVASRVVEIAARLRADAVFVDGGGVGGGVVDRCRQLNLPNLYEVQFGGKADRVNLEDEVKYANKRAEMWGGMREWLAVGSIPDDPDLRIQLTGVSYGHNGKEEILLERKADMKRRGLASPDIADGLALTFSWPVLPHEFAGGDHPAKPTVLIEYDPFGKEMMAA
jgi:hypothetical protein